MQTFRPTLYYLALESEYPQTNKNGVFKDRMDNVIHVGSLEFKKAAAIEGSAKLIDGRVINYDGGAAGSERWRIVKEPWGMGAKCPLIPLRSVAVDPKVIPLGSKLYIPKLKGMPLPGGGWHDGFVWAVDTGGAIKGDRVDIFTGAGQASMRPLYKYGIDHLVPLAFEIVGFSNECPTVAAPVSRAEFIPANDDLKLLAAYKMIKFCREAEVKEDQGPNRSKLIDQINQFMKVRLGSPYCIGALQYYSDKVEKEMRCEFRVPMTASVNNFFQHVDTRLIFQDPKMGDWACWVNPMTGLGHAELVATVLENRKWRSIGFNTSSSDPNSRDGEGKFEKVRSPTFLGANAFKGFVRVPDSMMIKI